MNGWIKVHRALAEHHVASDPHSLSVWIHMLMLANHRESKRQINGRVMVISPGQLITSRKSLADKTGVNESKVERILKMLQSEQLIEQHGTSKFRVISIVNWQKYQFDEQQDEQQENSKRTAGEQQMNTPEEIPNGIKKGKNGKKEANSASAPTNWVAVLLDLGVQEQHAKDWLQVRKGKNAKMTDTALKGVQREAAKAGITLAQAIKISAENSWQGFKAEWMINKGIGNGRTQASKPLSAVDRVKARAAERERARQGAQPEYFGGGDFIEGDFTAGRPGDGAPLDPYDGDLWPQVGEPVR